MPHLNLKVAEYAVIFNDNDEFLMLQFRASNNFRWHFPGGRLEGGDRSVHGLFREVFEETRLALSALRIFHTELFDEIDPKYGVFFLSKISKPKVIISSEHYDFRWFSEADVANIDFWQPFYRDMLCKAFRILRTEGFVPDVVSF